MTIRLDGQTAIVTGAGRGFGRAIAMGLAAAGSRVTVTARSRLELDATVAGIEQAGGTALAVAGDVTCPDDVDRVLAATERRFGPATLLVNNAGVAGPYGPVWVLDVDEWWNALSVHVRGTLLYMRAVVPGMVARGSGRIINVASAGGTRVNPNISGYSVAKAAQIRLTEHVAAEARAYGVSAFPIQPGTVVTEMAEGTLASPDARRWVPELLESLQEIKEREDPAVGLKRCADMCVRLASGRYDALSGRYLNPEDDFDRLLAEARALNFEEES